MDKHIHKRHNKTLLMYHLVFPVKYRKRIIEDSISSFLKEICIEIGERYEIQFIEIGTDEDHVHFLIQSIPSMSLDSIVRIIKSLTARQIFQYFPDIKKELWGGNLWTSGYYANTVGQYGNMEVIRKYVENQGRQYKQIHSQQLTLW
jgi:putative transposase